MRRKRKRGMHSWLCFLRVDLSDVRDEATRGDKISDCHPDRTTGHAGYNGQRGEGGISEISQDSLQGPWGK